MADLLHLVGARIRTLRKMRGLTQEALAEKAGIHYSYIGGVERGDRNISLETLEKIINALRVLPEEVFNFSNIDNYSEINDKRSLLDVINSSLINRSIEEIKLIQRITSDVFDTFDEK